MLPWLKIPARECMASNKTFIHQSSINIFIIFMVHICIGSFRCPCMCVHVCSSPCTRYVTETIVIVTFVVRLLYMPISIYMGPPSKKKTTEWLSSASNHTMYSLKLMHMYEYAGSVVVWMKVCLTDMFKRVICSVSWRVGIRVGGIQSDM